MSTNFAEHSELKKGPSVGTVVWGAVVVAIAGLLVVSRLGWFTIDLGVASVALLLLAGLGLVVGGGLAAARSRKAAGADPAAEASALPEAGGPGSNDHAGTDSSAGGPPHRNPYDAHGPYEGPSL
ncbi:MAG: hypothetical protein HOQ07_03885 [Sinomonas sp.]|nr:hypothetical protein [Sinomonas sp.]